MTFEQLTNIQLNGELLQLTQVDTVAALLEQQSLSNGRIVVVLNDEIVPKSRWNQQTINDGDLIDIMSPISGG